MSKVTYNITVSSDGVEQNINVYMHTLNSTNFPHYYDKYPAAPTSFDMDSFHMFGDANDDGLINSSDATAMLIDYAYSIVEGKSLLSAEVSDINGDGSIDSKDATIILIYYARSMVDDSAGSLKNFVESKNY